jgi:hypothetical protein
MTTPRDLHRALDEARTALSGMMRHSCVADSAPEDKDGDDYAAESAALRCIRNLDAIIDPMCLEPKLR